MKLRLDENESELYVVQKDCKVPATSTTKESPCPSTKMFDPEKGKSKIVDTAKKEIPYGENEIHGFYHQGKVCLNKKAETSCIADQKFFSIV